MIKKFAKFLLALLIILAGIYILLAALAKPAASHPFFETGDELLAIAHQGGNHLWPDNTLYAFENAWELGVDVLEMDLHSTQDGALVVMHDQTVDRTTDGSGPIQEYSLLEIQELDAGYHWSMDAGVTYPYRGQGIRVPQLAEVFSAFPTARINIEIKQTQPSIVAPLCALIREHAMADKVLIASFDQDTIQDFRSTCPEVATSAGERDVILLYALSLLYLEGLYSPAAQAVQVPEYRSGIHVLTDRFVQAAYNRGMHVHVWTVNEVDHMQRMLELGLDGIITDRPDRLLDLLGR